MCTKKMTTFGCAYMEIIVIINAMMVSMHENVNFLSFKTAFPHFEIESLSIYVKTIHLRNNAFMNGTT